MATLEHAADQLIERAQQCTAAVVDNYPVEGKQGAVFIGEERVFDNLANELQDIQLAELKHTNTALGKLNSLAPEAANTIAEYINANRNDPAVIELITLTELTLEATDKISTPEYSTYDHVQNVTALTLALADEAGKRPDGPEMSPKEQFELFIATANHDFGKILTPEAVLNKPSRLDNDEFVIMKHHAAHTEKAFEQLSPAVQEQFPGIGMISAAHHESPTGKGYPFNLTEEQTPLGAKYMKIADCFEAATAERPYSPAKSAAQVMAEFHEEGLSSFHKEALPIFVTSDLPEKFDAMRGMDSWKLEESAALNAARIETWQQQQHSQLAEMQEQLALQMQQMQAMSETIQSVLASQYSEQNIGRYEGLPLAH